MDLKLDTVGGTLAIANGDLVLVDGLDAIAQDLATRLRFFLGEWFLDTKAGVPLYQRILVKNPSIPDVLATLTKVILTTPGIKSITKAVALSLNVAARAMTVSFQADTISGPLTFSRELIV